MYPIRRQIIEAIRCRKMKPLAPGDAHVTHMRALPWDIDPFGDLNNGRILTLSDVARIGLCQRMGLIKAMRQHRWGFAMAGSAPHYRRRVTMWEKLAFHSRFVGHDERFFFVEQTLYAAGEPAFNVMCRSVVTSKGRIAPPTEVLAAMGFDGWNPTPPIWVTSWAAADSERPWPPAIMA